MNTSEILNRAADLIEEKGWAQAGGWYGEEKYGGSAGGKLCLEGGIQAAMNLPMGGKNDMIFHTCPAFQSVREYLRHTMFYAPFAWNDRPERTAEEVIEVLRACALIEASREEQDAAYATYAPNLASVSS